MHAFCGHLACSMTRLHLPPCNWDAAYFHEGVCSFRHACTCAGGR